MPLEGYACGKTSCLVKNKTFEKTQTKMIEIISKFQKIFYLFDEDLALKFNPSTPGVH